MSFCYAVAEGEVETVRALLARGEDPNKKEDGSAALEWAMSLLSNIKNTDLVRDVFACVELCLDAGADPNVLWDERVCGTPLDEEDINRARRESSESECIFCFYRVF